MKQRMELTDEEHVNLIDVGNEFWSKFSALVAEAVNKMPKELESLTLAYLSDHSSVYGSDYMSHLNENRP